MVTLRIFFKRISTQIAPVCFEDEVASEHRSY